MKDDCTYIVVDGREWTFMSSTVALPLRGYGSIMSPGWDIPQNWAIDASGMCWMDAAHGPTLYEVSISYLLSACETIADKQSVAKILDLEMVSTPCTECDGRGHVMLPDMTKIAKLGFPKRGEE